MECPWEEQDLGGRAPRFGGADEGGYCFEVVLVGVRLGCVRGRGKERYGDNAYYAVATFFGCLQYFDRFIVFH